MKFIPHEYQKFALQFIIDSAADSIKSEREKMSGLASPNWDGMPHMSSPGTGEDRILDGLEEIYILKERYRQAVEYMDWFRPAWEQLTEDERYCLETFTVARILTGVMRRTLLRRT